MRFYVKSEKKLDQFSNFEFIPKIYYGLTFQTAKRH